jgi:hypothetical protein
MSEGEGRGVDPLAVHWQWAVQSSSEEPGFTELHGPQTMTKGEGTGYYPEDMGHLGLMLISHTFSQATKIGGRWGKNPTRCNVGFALACKNRA